MEKSKTPLHIVTCDEGPPLTQAQQDSLQAGLGDEYLVSGVTAEAFLENPPADGIVWPYYRGIPSTQNDVLLLVDDTKLTVINNYQVQPNWSDKLSSHEHAEKHDVPTLYTVGLSEVSDIDHLDIEYPMVLKGYPSGRGADVHLCEDQQQAVKVFASLREKGLGVLAQEYIAESRGTDLRVLIAHGKVALCLKRRGAEGSFLSNVSQGGRYEKYELSDADEAVIRSVIDNFPVDVAGVDFLFSDRGLLFNEINLAPGWSGEAEAIVPYLVELVRVKNLVRQVLTSGPRTVLPVFFDKTVDPVPVAA